MKSNYFRNNFKYLALGFLFLVTVSNSAIAKPLEFSAAYGPDQTVPLPKSKLSERSVLVIESERQFRKIFGVSSQLNINWKENFLILAFAGQRSSSGFGLSVDAVALNSTKSLQNKKSSKKNVGANMIAVAVTESTPGPFCFTASVITHPTALIKVKRVRHLKPKRSKRISAGLQSYNAVAGGACSLTVS
jgi:hypothetical protein